MSTTNKLDEPYKGQKFKSFDALKKYLEEYGQRNYVKFWIRSSHTRNSLKSKISKTMNPDLKYVCVKFACIFGGEKIRCRGSGIRKSSTYRDLGCPCMINAVVGEDGNHVKLDTVNLEHNHVLCKTLYESLKKTKRKSQTILNNRSFIDKPVAPECQDIKFGHDKISYLLLDENNDNKEEESGIIINTNNDENDTPVLTQTESPQNCLRNIKEKYGSNVKILVVNSNSTFNTFNDSLNLTNENNESSECLQSINIGEICRLCLSSKENLTPIFNPDSPLKSTVLSFKIMGCASIEITANDGLPNNICTSCEAELDIAYNFRLRCENSDSILRKAHLQKEILEPSEKVLLQHPANSISEEISTQQNRNLNVPLLSFYETDKALKSEEMNQTVGQDPLFVQFAITCPICTAEYDTYESLIDHLTTHSDNETLLLACNICNFMCPTVFELQDHMRHHLSQLKADRYSCSQCEAIFLSGEELKAHEESHTVPADAIPEPQAKKQSDVSYLCNVCGKILKTKDRFRSHKNTHEGLRPHVCLKCGRGFADRKNMHHHYNVVHLRKPKLECPVCQKKFYTRTKMKSHVTMHYGVKPFACDICGKTFRLKMNMIKHKKTHSNDRPHKCDKCNAAFIDKNMLKRHSYIHGGIRPYPCPVCGHRFSVKFHLKKHLEKSKCSATAMVLSTDYQWVGIPQPEQVLQDNECVIVYKGTEDGVLQENGETIAMSILQEYQHESVS